MFSRYMFDAMGVQWVGTLLGCVAALLVPIPVVFYLYGAKIRQKSTFAPTPPPLPHGHDEESSAEKTE